MKKIVNGVLLVFLCMSLFITVDMSQNARSSPNAGTSWLLGWTYRKSHVISSATGAGTDYQVGVKVYYGNGVDGTDITEGMVVGKVYCNSHCNPEFGDIRFTASDGTALLDYWMQDMTSAASAVFWVQISEDLSSVSRTIYIYYGNSGATTTSNGDNTFLFFDDFSGASLNPAKWSMIGTYFTASVSNSELRLTSSVATPLDNYLNGTSWSGGPNISLRMRSKDDTAKSRVCLTNLGYNKIDYSADVLGRGIYGDGQYCYDAAHGGHRSLVGPWNNDWTYRIYEYKWASSKIQFFKDGIQEGVDITTNIPITEQNIRLGNPYNSGTGGSMGQYWDWIYTRKYVDPEPAPGSWGSEDEESGACLRFDPSTVLTSPGQSFSVNLRVSNVSDLYLWVFSVSWDSNALEFMNITEGEFLRRGGSTTGILVKEMNQSGGYLKEASCSLMGNAQGVGGDGDLATIMFKANGNNVPGSSDLNIYFCDLMDSNGSSISCDTVNGVVDVGEDLRIVNADVPYPGSPKYANITILMNITIMEIGTAGVGAFNVSFTAYWDDGEVTEHFEKLRVETLEASKNETLGFYYAPNHTGNYTFTFMVDCDSDIIEFNETNNELSLRAKVQVQGDINGDGQVNYKDLFILAKAYWTTPTDPNWNPIADINCDGVVDYKDLFILSKNYS